MYDYLRRILIVLAVALSIGLLFFSATVSFAASNEKYELTNFIWPAEGYVSDTFGTRNGKHYGIDIAAPRGTTVVSVSDGVVSKSYYSRTYGNVVFIEHTTGFETVYAHLHERFVKNGDKVSKGDKIGTVGNTGRSSGNHLHFEVHDGNWHMSKTNAIDPFLVLEDEMIETDQYQVASTTKILEELPRNTENEGWLIVTVSQGDNLWKLAKKYEVSIEDIVKWNELKTDKLIVNDKLKIIPKGKYIVQKGDTLWKISEQSGVSISNLKKINGLKGDKIQVGSILHLDK